MTDYGHDLTFGTFVTPDSRYPERVLELAQRTEHAGLDLVTFMDHPHHPGFLDTWTLLSFVAARTKRVHLSGYVLNLPSRHPAVLARAAASLDRLSGGRLELGLGPGDTYAADANTAMGAPKLTPGESIEALDEAIDIIRGIWATSQPGPVTMNGRHYPNIRVLRGPQPAHDISLWIPAGGPRARALVGRKADGWITGGAWMKAIDRELAEGSKQVDEAAVAAGRDPRSIRRIFDFYGDDHRGQRPLAQGGPSEWVDILLPLVTEYGVGTFILASDDPRSIDVWGREVVPALRESVARERSGS